VHVGRPAQDRRPVGRHPQAVLVSPHRLVQATLGEADLRQRSVATDRIDGVARTLKEAIASDQKPWAASRSPFPQCAKARNPAPALPGAIAGQGEGFQGEGFDALGVALELRLGGSIQGDRTRQPLELSFVRHDHRPGRDRLVSTLAGCRFQPSLGALQERFDVGDLAMGH
jgi:hypothetical protein